MLAPWQPAGHPFIARWLEANTAALDRFVTASHRPHYYSPVHGEVLVGYSQPELYVSRAIAKALSARAQQRIAAGDLEGAVEDVLALRRWNALMHQQGPVITSLVGVSLAHLSREAMRHLAAADTLTVPQRRHIRSTLVEHGEARITARTIMFERFTSLDTIQQVGRREKVVSMDDSFRRLVTLKKREGFDINHVLQDVNQQYDAIAKATQIEDPRRRLKRIRRIEEHLDARRNESMALLAPSTARFRKSVPQDRLNDAAVGFALVHVAPVENAMKVHARAALFERIERVLLAVGAYRAANGELPSGLNALPAETRNRLPRDLDGDALRYAVQDGRAVVWSVGLNMKDDGATAADQKGLVLRLP